MTLKHKVNYSVGIIKNGKLLLEPTWVKIKQNSSINMTEFTFTLFNLMDDQLKGIYKYFIYASKKLDFEKCDIVFNKVVDNSKIEETWILKGCFPKSFNFEELSESPAELSQITITWQITSVHRRNFSPFKNNCVEIIESDYNL